MNAIVDGVTVTLHKDPVTKQWVRNPVAPVEANNTSLAIPGNPSDDFKKGFFTAFDQLGAVLDGVAESGELQRALDRFRELRRQGKSLDRNVSFQELLSLINDCADRRGVDLSRTAIQNRTAGYLESRNRRR